MRLVLIVLAVIAMSCAPFRFAQGQVKVRTKRVAATQLYDVKDARTFGFDSSPVQIASNGILAGEISISGTAHVAVWKNGKLRDVGTLGGSKSSVPGGINSRGDIVGNSSMTPTL